jgi:hypothetical protein
MPTLYSHENANLLCSQPFVSDNGNQGLPQQKKIEITMVTFFMSGVTGDMRENKYAVRGKLN